MPYQVFAPYTVTTTPGPIVAVPSGTSTVQMVHGVTVQADKANTATLFVGDASVTTLTGIELAAGDIYSAPVGHPSKIYAVVVTGTQKLRIQGA